MIAKSKPKNSWLTVLLLIAAVAVWAYHETQAPNTTPREAPRPAPSSEGPPRAPARTGHYETYRGCILVESRGNDGDSFLLKLPDGRNVEFRLYFVDAPESDFKNYGGGRNNHSRIQDQAADLGGITPQQAVTIGKKAKDFTLATLSARPFVIHTNWDSPFNDNRFHAFVELEQTGKRRWLHEVLVEKGLVRIHTKGADLPDGTSYAKHKAHLKDLQSAAKKDGLGAWGL